MRFSEPRRSKAPVINVTSLIDVIFLLVIFLLITAKYDTEGGIAVDLPKASSQEVPKSFDVYDVTIMHDGTLFLGQDKVLAGELPAKIQEMRARMNDPVLVIRTDRDAPAGMIIMVTEVAKRTGQRKLNFKTKQ